MNVSPSRDPMAAPSLIDIAKGTPGVEVDLLRMEIHLGLPDGFILDLLKKGDDWTFILRLHALVETSLDYLIVAKLDYPSLHHWISRHNIAGRTGKKTLALLIQAIDDNDGAMVEGLSDLRNQFAHGIRLMGVRLSEYIDRIDNGERIKVLRWILKSQGQRSSTELEALALDAWRKSPRLVLWMACSALIENAYRVRRTARGSEIEEAFGLRTESGDLLTTEDGQVIVTESAPDVDERRSTG